MADADGGSGYRSYVLRLWWDAGGGQWRCSLEDPATRQRRGFADLDALSDYLRSAATSVHAREPLRES